MQVLTKFAISADGPDFTFSRVKAFLASLPGGLSRIEGPVTDGMVLSLSGPNPSLADSENVVQEEVAKPMTVINDIQISLDESALTFTITKTEVSFDRGGVSAPSDPVVETVTVNLPP